MLAIGERINTVRKTVLEAYERKDSEFFRQEAIRQAEAGADVIDINAGTDITVEPKNMAWAVSVVQDAIDLPLCIDSPNPETIRAGFNACRNKSSAWANSINIEKNRIEGVLPVVKEHGCPVVGLCMDLSGIPQTAEKRVEVGKRLAEIVDRYGIPLEKLYLDPLIEPVSVEQNRGLVCLDTIKGIKSALPEVRTVICLSAVSFGLPRRRLLHRAYLPLLMYEGIDSVILDPLDHPLMMGLIAAETVMGRDESCMKYLTAHREGKLGEHVG